MLIARLLRQLWHLVQKPRLLIAYGAEQDGLDPF
jgi:hypothetical protein